VPKGPISLLAADGAIWAADYDGAAVTRIDPATDRVTGGIRVGPKPVSLLVAHGKLWVFNQGDDTASVVDPNTMRVLRTIRVRVAAGFASVHDGLLWVPDFQGGSHKVIAVDPATSRTVRAAQVGSMPVRVGFGMGSGWTGNGPDDTVTRFNPETNTAVGTLTIGSEPNDIAALDGYLWVSESGGDEVAVIRPG
jgi:YVTN family beta-propeller protein